MSDEPNETGTVMGPSPDGTPSSVPSAPPSSPPVAPPTTPPVPAPPAVEAVPPVPDVVPPTPEPRVPDLPVETVAGPPPTPPTDDPSTPTPEPTGGGGRPKWLLAVLALVVLAVIGVGAVIMLSSDDDDSAVGDTSVGAGRSEALIQVFEDGEIDTFVLEPGSTIEREDRISRGASTFSLLYEGGRADRFSGTTPPSSSGTYVPLLVGSRIVVLENDGSDEYVQTIDVDTGETVELYSVDALDDRLAVTHDRGTYVYVVSSGERQTCLVADGLVEPTRLARTTSCRAIPGGVLAIDEDDGRYEVEKLDYDGATVWAATFDVSPSIHLGDGGPGYIYAEERDGRNRFVIVRDLATGEEVGRSSSGFTAEAVVGSDGGKLLVAVSDGNGDQTLEIVEPGVETPTEILTTDERVRASFLGENRIVYIAGEPRDEDGELRRQDLVALDLDTLEETVVLDERGLSMAVVDDALIAMAGDDAELEVWTAPRRSLQLVSSVVADSDDPRVRSYWLSGDTLDVFVSSSDEGSGVLYRTPLGGEGTPIIEDVDEVQLLDTNGGATLYRTLDDVEQTMWYVAPDGVSTDVDEGDRIRAWFDRSGDNIIYLDQEIDEPFGELVSVKVDESGPAETIADEASFFVPLWRKEGPVQRGIAETTVPTTDGCASESASTRVGRTFSDTATTSGPISICLSSMGEWIDFEVEADFNGSIEIYDLETDAFLDSFGMFDFQDYSLPFGAVRVEVWAWEEADDMSFSISFVPS